MQYSSAILIAAFAVTSVFTHGVVDSVVGANDVTMPGLSVADGTPRDCASPRCGSEADTSIIRKREMGTNKATALGRTQGGGPVDASKMMAMFMGGGGNATATKAAREVHAANVLRRSLGERAANGGIRTPKGTMETGVKAAAGVGASSGMPTCSDDGKVKMTYHQINQDGAGPLTAMVDATSGGTDPAAFKSAEVTQNVPGIGIGGLSAAAVMDFPVEVQMPAGMTCSGTVGDAQNVCIVRMQNAAAAGPFGGSVAVTQSPAAKKRAIEYNLSKRHFARALAKRNAEDDAAAAAAIAELEKIGSATKDEQAEKEDAVEAPLTKKSAEDDAAAAAAIAELEKIGSATKDEEASSAAVVTKRDTDLDAAQKAESEALDAETEAEDKE
ncbi:Bgt-51561 [Blumeria graminis f. sp. tritici]|uniref:Bgt-51561 n=1 Tax=Blumeria graminis f. sp. tritici TaxID=62690 RepID=A0A9X9LBY1_BLUGR|nr:Bgt-51561 [Blumeria graminis f. sp. tritici]